MKAKNEIVCFGLVVGVLLNTLAAGFNTVPNRRLESPRLRTVKASPAKGSSTKDASPKAGTNARSSASLLPEGFEAGDEPTAKGSLAEGNRKVLSAEGMSLKGSLKVEYGEGHGDTIDEALKEAMKDVLQKVVGVYVDSDFRMNNDQIIKDEIITHSNGSSTITRRWRNRMIPMGVASPSRSRPGSRCAILSTA